MTPAVEVQSFNHREVPRVTFVFILPITFITKKFFLIEG